MRELRPDELYRRCDPDQFGFGDTSEVPDLDDIVGQDRAVAAIRFGVEIEQEGFNLFAMGPSGIGKHHVISEFIHRRSREQPVPRSWIYVHNFDDSRAPRAISLAPGRAAEAKAATEQLRTDVETAVRSVFESEEFRASRRAIHLKFDQQREKALQAINEEGRGGGIALVQTQDGLTLSPIVEGELLEPEEIDALPEEEQDRLQEAREELDKKLRATLDEFPRWDRERREAIISLQKDVVRSAVRELFDALQSDFEESDVFVEHLDRLEAYIVEDPSQFLHEDDEAPSSPFGPGGRNPNDSIHPFAVNVLVDHCDTDEGAPVVYEDDPTTENLLGRIEYESQYGALFTNHTLIRPGAMHEANGGYLVVDARKLLSNPMSWEQLKRTLYARELRVDSAREGGFAPNTLSLTPDPIPLSVKVVLVGERQTYYALRELDPDMDELFKVTADFDTLMERDNETMQTYAALLATLGRREDLRPIDRSGVARVIEHSSRIAADSTKLTTHMRNIADLLRESDFWADSDDADVIAAEHIQRTIDEREHRNGRIRDRLAEQVRDEVIVIETDGEVIGEINGLSVMTFGPSAFGRPTRISANASLGSGEVVDIEREVDLGGPIHSKGVLILKSFLASKFALDAPLSLSAHIVFEQSYSGVDGDSASAAETCALLSAIARIPLKRSLAMTGALDQRGRIQAVGGVNEKIEGFFDVCQERGLTGDQGVILPASNVDDLMLRTSVVEAVEGGKFHIYAAKHVDEAIELLTGRSAEQVYTEVRERLADFSARQRSYRYGLSED